MPAKAPASPLDPGTFREVLARLDRAVAELRDVRQTLEKLPESKGGKS